MTPWRSNGSWNYGGWSRSGRAGGGWSQGGSQGGNGGHSSQAASKSGWWDCTAKSCVLVCKKKGRGPWSNPPAAAECQICHAGKPTSNGKTLKEELQAEVAAAGGGRTYAQVASGASPGTTAVTVPPCDVFHSPLDSDVEVDNVVTVLALPQEYEAAANALRDPPTLTAEWTVEAAAAKHLPKKGATDVAKLEADLSDLGLKLDLQVRKVIPASDSEVAATRKKAAALEKALEEAQLDSVAALAASELEVSLKKHVREEETRTARACAAEVKADENADRLEEICREQAAAWQEQLLVVERARAVRQAAWTSRRLLHESRGLQVQELYQQKIDEAKNRAPQGATPQVQTISFQVQDAKAELTKLQAESEAALKQAAEEKQTLIARIEALEKATASVSQAASDEVARMTDLVYRQCHSTIVYEESELPTLNSTLDKDAKRSLVLVSTNLAKWSQIGMVPLTFGHLLSGAVAPATVKAAMKLLEELIGEQIWSRFFLGNEVLPDHYVPFQLGAIIMKALINCDAVLKKCAKEFDFSDNAKKRFEELKSEDDAAKRRRSGPYSRC